MNTAILQTHPHLRFHKNWELTSKSWLLLGQCEAYVKAISGTPILPEDHKRLLRVALIKGALATTAIEGNTLTEEEAERIFQGEHLAPSKEYQEIEVNNVINAFNELLSTVVYQNNAEIITPQLIKEFHKKIGKGLGKHFDAIPGQFRTDNRVVGPYRTPEYKYVTDLMIEFCEWLKHEFHYASGQGFADVVIQAIVSHVFLEWIHPFGDGNGRTGRLLEFYILLRGGNPDIASHILSNHYNETRSEYYRQINNARKKTSLTEFIEYALEGLKDGLVQTMAVTQRSQFKIAWDKFVYDKFDKTKMKSRNVFKRRRTLMLAFPLDKVVSFEEIPIINTEIARMFAGLSNRTVSRDVTELINMELLSRTTDGKYRANSSVLMLTGHLATRRIP